MIDDNARAAPLGSPPASPPALILFIGNFVQLGHIGRQFAAGGGTYSSTFLLKLRAVFVTYYYP